MTEQLPRKRVEPPVNAYVYFMRGFPDNIKTLYPMRYMMAMKDKDRYNREVHTHRKNK